MARKKREKCKSGQLLLALIDEPGCYAAKADPRLMPGDHVKLGFAVDPHFREQGLRGEWMWIEVTAVEGDWPQALYRGELCSRPRLIDPTVLRVGQPISFRGENVYGVVHDSPARPEGERETLAEYLARCDAALRRAKPGD
jgi:hypothetical protein